MNSCDISSLLLNIHWLRTRQQWIQNRATYLMSFKGKFERKILMGWKVSSAPIVAPTNRQVSLNMSFLKLQLVVNYCAIDFFFFYEACTISIELWDLRRIGHLALYWSRDHGNILEKPVSLSKLQLIKIHLLWLRLALLFFTTVLCFFSTVPCFFQFGAVFFFHYGSLLFFSTVPCFFQYGTLLFSVRCLAFFITVPCFFQYGTLLFFSTVPCFLQYGTLLFQYGCLSFQYGALLFCSERCQIPFHAIWLSLRPCIIIEAIK